MDTYFPRENNGGLVDSRKSTGDASNCFMVIHRPPTEYSPRESFIPFFEYRVREKEKNAYKRFLLRESAVIDDEVKFGPRSRLLYLEGGSARACCGN